MSYPVGPCEQDACPGTIVAVIRASDNIAPTALVCGTCGWELPATEWLRFGLARLEQHTPPTLETAS